jgi:hypothetical protein
VTDFERVSYISSAFNNGGSPSIGNWNTSKVTTMLGMFYQTSFNQPIGKGSYC